MCKRFEELKSKGSIDLVVGINCGRGAPIPTRYGVPVVRRESSCLGVVAELGMEDGGSDSEGCRKRGGI